MKHNLYILPRVKSAGPSVLPNLNPSMSSAWCDLKQNSELPFWLKHFLNLALTLKKIPTLIQPWVCLAITSIIKCLSSNPFIKASHQLPASLQEKKKISLNVKHLRRQKCSKKVCEQLWGLGCGGRVHNSIKWCKEGDYGVGQKGNKKSFSLFDWRFCPILAMSQGISSCHSLVTYNPKTWSSQRQPTILQNQEGETLHCHWSEDNSNTCWKLGFYFK